MRRLEPSGKVMAIIYLVSDHNEIHPTNIYLRREPKLNPIYP